MKSTTLSLLTLLSATTLAVPTVTPIPLPLNTCRHWPNWLNARPFDTTGHLSLLVHSAEEPFLNNFPGLTFKTSYGGNNTAGFRNYVGITLTPASQFAKEYFRCSDGAIGDRQTFSPLRISAGPQNAHLVKDGAANEGPDWESYQPGLYKHIGADGKEIEGLFLGAENKTTWGFGYHEPVECDRNGWWEMKLLDLPQGNREFTASRPIMFKGFIQVVGS